MSPLRPRVSGAAEASAAAELFALCLHEAWPAEAVDRCRAERGGCLLVLEDEAGLAGALLLRTVEEEAEVLQVAVHPDRRGRGHGRQLLRAGEATAIERGASRCFLEVRAENLAARSLYESSGYEQVGCRAGYYSDGEDALVLARDLRPKALPGA